MNKQMKYVLLTCAGVLAGCSQETTAPSGVKIRQDVLHVEQDRGISTADVMEVAEDVLTGMHFTIEKADLQNGIIRTRPLPGAQFFEFWRSDNVGAGNTFAANLHTIRRTATLEISRHNMELLIGCTTQTQRLSLPERQVSSSARVYGIFTRSSRSLQRLQLNPEQAKEMTWIDLGRDSQLEAEILRRIEKQIILLTNHRLQTTETKT